MTLCQCVLIAAILNLHLCEVTQYVMAPLCCVVLGFVSSGFQKCILCFAFINNDLFLAFKPLLKLCEWALVDVVLKDVCFHLSLYGLSLKKPHMGASLHFKIPLSIVFPEAVSLA